ncbi:hypothetical protein HID58_023678, partial [Brassica napus]
MQDMKMNEASENVAVELAAQGGFMMALDYMIQLADKNQDDKVNQERQELLRRVAAGGGAFESKDGNKLHLPGGNLNDIANQAGNLLETMETRPVVPDRILLARLVSRNMMGGGILDERNDRGFSTLPESEVLLLCPSHHVNFLTKLVALKPGKSVQQMTQNVMQGKDEGADDLSNREDSSTQGRRQSGLNGRGSVTGRKPLPVRPGMFLETVTKVYFKIASSKKMI